LAQETFHGGADLAGFLMVVLGVGTVIGGLSAAHRARPTPRTVRASGVALGVSMLVAAVLPAETAVVIALVPLGALAIFFGSTANGHMQITSAPEFRGRVMAIYSLLTLGTTVVGGPFIGWVCQTWSPRVGIGLAGVTTALVAASLALPRLRARQPIMSVDLVGP
jgi:predicted MFS family arabinose efflux permease